jgi:hypothetical protein
MPGGVQLYCGPSAAASTAPSDTVGRSDALVPASLVEPAPASASAAPAVPPAAPPPEGFDAPGEQAARSTGASTSAARTHWDSRLHTANLLTRVGVAPRNARK